MRSMLEFTAGPTRWIGRDAQGVEADRTGRDRPWQIEEPAWCPRDICAFVGTTSLMHRR